MTRIVDDFVAFDSEGVDSNPVPSTQTPEATTSQEIQPQGQLETQSPSQSIVNQLAGFVTDASVSASSHLKKQMSKHIFIAIMGYE